MPFDQTRHEAVQSAATRSHKLQDVFAVTVTLQCAFNLTYIIEIPADGDYALFTEHHPDEFQAKLVNAGGEQSAHIERLFKPDHEHDEEVSSVGIDVVGDLDKRRFNQWLSHLLQTQGTDIFRMKGIISLKGEKERFVFQGVHMLFDGRPDRPWGANARRNQLISSSVAILTVLL